MLGLSFFTSKSGLSLFSALLIIVSLFYTDWKLLLKEKWLVLFALTLPLGMFLNLFSLGGWESSVKFFIANPWPLMIVPGFHLVKQKSVVRPLLWAMALSLVVAMLKSAFIFYHEYGLVFTSKTRIRSFYDVGRWGQFLSATAVSLLVLSYPSKELKRWISVGVRVLFVFAVFFLVLANTRGPWLAFLICTAFAIIMKKKFLKAVGSVIVTGCILILFIDGVESRVASIFAIKMDQAGRITSTDFSNAGRLHMWKVAIDRFPENLYFGSGFRNTETPLRSFLEKQSDDYRAKYLTANFSYKDAHSSYLQSLTEMGVVFFLYYWGLMLSFFLYMSRKFISYGKSTCFLSSTIILSSLIVYVFYSSYESYENIIVALAFVLSASGQKGSKS